ncbi:MAG TPA: hypothetical protein VHK88_20065 [Aquihabitans sp.]|jgi:hypothetical protein|nr:hypothetical protein [Aquihabitans sp.]
MTPGITVWVVEKVDDNVDYGCNPDTEILGVYATLAAAQEHHPSPAWGHHDPVGAYPEAWVSADGGLTIEPYVVQGPPVRCRHCHELDPAHDPDCPEATR